jgi:hypothetical protein
MPHLRGELAGGLVRHRARVNVRNAPLATFVDHDVSGEHHGGQGFRVGWTMRFGNCVDDGAKAVVHADVERFDRHGREFELDLQMQLTNSSSIHRPIKLSILTSATA